MIPRSRLTSLFIFSSRKDHEKAEFEVHEVYAVDVLVSSGEGKVSAVEAAAFRLPAGERSSPGYRCVFLSGAFSTRNVKVDFYGFGAGPVLVRVAPAPLSCPLSEYMHFQAKDAGQRTTIYKRDPSKQYGLKMKTSRAFFSEVERRFDTMPFTLRYSPSFPAQEPTPKPTPFPRPRGGGGFCRVPVGFEWAQEGCGGLGRNPAAGAEPGIAFKIKLNRGGCGKRRQENNVRFSSLNPLFRSPGVDDVPNLDAGDGSEGHGVECGSGAAASPPQGV